MLIMRLCSHKNNTLITQRALKWAERLQEWIINFSVLTTLGAWPFKHSGTLSVGMCYVRHLVGVESSTRWQYSFLSAFIPLKIICHFGVFICSLNFRITSLRNLRILPGWWSWYNQSRHKDMTKKDQSKSIMYKYIYNCLPLWFSHSLVVFFYAKYADESTFPKL